MFFRAFVETDMRAGPTRDGIIFHDDRVGIFGIETELPDGIAVDSDLRFAEQGRHVHRGRVVTDYPVAQRNKNEIFIEVVITTGIDDPVFIQFDEWLNVSEFVLAAAEDDCVIGFF